MAIGSRQTKFTARVKVTADLTEFNAAMKAATSDRTINMTSTVKSLNSVGTAAQKSTPQVSNFATQLSKLRDTTIKVATFGAITAAISAFTSAISSAIDDVVAFDKSIEELEKVVGNFTNNELSDFTDKVAEMGEQLSASMTDVTDAITTFVKTGASLEESEGLAEVAIQMQHTADETLEASTAAETLIAVMKAYGTTSEDADHVADAINNVSANFAISSGQIITNIGKVASTMAAGNTSFEETLGLMTAITTETRNASKAANSLKTIGQRIRGVGEDAEEGLTASLQELFDQYGIQIDILNEQTGEMASTYDILAAMADKWEDLTDAQRQNLGETAAGKNRITEFNALMNSFNITLGATEAAYESAGITSEQFAIYQDSIEGKIASLKEQWEQLVNEGGIINKFIRLILDAGTAILKLANSDLVQFLAKATLVVAITTKLYQLGTFIIPMLTGTVTGTRNIITVLTKLGGTLNVVNIAAQKLSTTIKSIPLVGWAAAGITALIALGKYASNFNTRQLEKAQEKLQDAQEALTETTNKLDELQAEYNELNNIDEDDLTKAEKHRLAIITAEIEKYKELQKEQQKTEFEAFGEQKVEGDVEAIGAGLGGYGGVSGTKTGLIDQDEYYAKEIKNVDDVTAEYIEYIDTLNDYSEAGMELDDVQQQNLETGLELIDAYNDLHNATEANTDVTGAYTSVAQASVNALQTQNEEFLTSWQNIQDLVTAEQQLRNGQALTEEQIISLVNKYPTLINYINAMRNGDLSAAEAMKVLAKQSLNTSKTVIANSKAEAKAIVQDTEIEIKAILADITALQAKMLATGDEQRVIQQTAEYKALSNSLKDVSAAYAEALSLYNLFSDAVDYGTTDTSSSTSSTTKDTTNEIKEMYESASEYMTDSIQSAIDQLEEQKDAISETNDELENQIELEEKLKALEEARSKKVLVYENGQFKYASDVDAISEAQSDYNETLREQQQEAQEKAIDEQIEALEAEKDAWDNIVDAYETAEERLQAAQVLGIKAEGENWKERLGMAKEYAQKYAALMGTTLTDAQWNEIVGNTSSSTVLKDLTSGTNATSTVTTTTSKNTTINISNITLPNVTDADSFVSDLTNNFTNIAMQTSEVRT